MNHAIMGHLQDVFNLLPNLSTPAKGSGPKNGEHASTENNELARAMSVKTNDQLMAIYLSSLIRAITAFHDLIENKIQNRQAQEERDGKKDDEKEGEEAKTNGSAGPEAENGKTDSSDSKAGAKDAGKSAEKKK